MGIFRLNDEDPHMKNFLALLFVFFQAFFLSAQHIRPQVDQRIEMVSIAARLAEYDEYSQPDAKQYVSAIHTHFNAYKTDTLIGLLHTLRYENGMGFDAVMSMAVHLKQVNHKFVLKKGWQKGLDKRWPRKSAENFVVLLNAFYQESKAETFFVQQKPYYDKVLTAFEKVLVNFNQNWYFNYYGVAPKHRFNIVIGCGNGGGNYGPGTNSPEDGKQIYAIMGSWSFDEHGAPFFTVEDYLPTLIHEFNHAFINPLLDVHKKNKQLRQNGQVLLDSMKNEMNRKAYADWEAVINESLVRAAVVRYIAAGGGTAADQKNEIMLQHNIGFLWTDQLVTLLETYEKNRDKYKTLAAFYPLIIDFFKTTATNIHQIKTTYKAKTPVVVSIEPFKNNAQDVDASLTEMTIRFSEPLTGEGYSFNYGVLGQESFPIKGVIGYADNNTSFKLTLALTPNTAYEMVITGVSFANAAGYPLNDYTVKFKTKP